VVPLLEQTVGKARDIMIVLLGAVAFMLLIACGQCLQPALDARRGTAIYKSAGVPSRTEHVMTRAASKIGAGWIY
jgi:hypothetical protein